MSRVVAGTLLLPNGQPMANASIYFTAKRTEPVSIIEGSNTFFTTNGAGVYNQTVVNGFYAVSIEFIADASGAYTRRWQLGDVFIETGATTTLEALIIASNVPDDIALGVFYEILGQAQAAAASATASAAAAAASAATITPTTSPTDTTPGRLWRTNDLVKTTSQIDYTAGRMLRVGDGGILGTTPLAPSNDLNSAAGAMASGLYRYESTTAGLPLAGSNGNVLHMRRAAGGGEARLAIRDTDISGGVRAFLQIRSTSVWQSWEELWHTANLVKVSSLSDQTAGRIATVAWMGLGAGGVDVPDMTSADVNVARFFRLTSAAVGGTGQNGGAIALPYGGGGPITAFLQVNPSGRIFSGVKSTASGTPVWVEQYGKSNTSVDVQSLLAAANNSAIRTSIDSSVFPSYTVSTVPIASANANKGIIVTNAASGRRPYWSNGTDWRDASNTILS